ncbi:TetR/AcrR family transcriptional regulator [Actinomadura napierensis]|uniref:TetR/AcrR family transcriptional regulator n=1 Tax=Actinomadura napierensis TaxID=267854 RepID=A0ABN2XYE3_9ACTN
MTNSRRQEHTADTRAALLGAARRLFAEQGYAGTGTEEIVARARVTRGALYHHFRDKADLFAAVMRTVAGELAEHLIQQQLAGPGGRPAGPLDELRSGLQAYLDACLDGDFQRIVLVDGPAVLGPAAWNELIDQHGLHLLRDWLRQAVADGQIAPLPVDVLARLLAALIAEAGLYIAHESDPAAARDKAGVALDHILRGLGHTPE